MECLIQNRGGLSLVVDAQGHEYDCVEWVDLWWSDMGLALIQQRANYAVPTRRQLFIPAPVTVYPDRSRRRR